MAERLTLPVLPLREVVLFPGVTAPINAGKPATLRAIEAALATPERLVFAVSQREDVPQVTPEVLHTIGTVARIGQVQRGLAVPDDDIFDGLILDTDDLPLRRFRPDKFGMP